MARLIYESERPLFAIAVDSRQWILYKGKSISKKTGKAEWYDLSYFPTLSLLLDDLIEVLFRRMVTKVKILEDLDKTIDKVYKIVDKACFGVKHEKMKKKMGGDK